MSTLTPEERMTNERLAEIDAAMANDDLDARLDPSGVLSNESVLCGFVDELRAEVRRLRSGPDLPPVPRDKGCNMHPDCDAAEEAAARAGKPERYGPGSQRLEHCTDEFCEDCHGT